MKLTRLIPIASLATVCGVALSALLVDSPPNFPFTEPPLGAAPHAPVLGIGDSTFYGRVVNGEGEPIEGAGLTTRTGPRPSFARSREDGAFELNKLLGPGGRLLVTAIGFEATKFDLDTWPTTSADARFDVVLTLSLIHI